MYARTSKLSCLSPLFPVLFKRIRRTNTWFAPHYKLFLNAVLPNARWLWIWDVLPRYSGISSSAYLDSPFKLRLAEIDRLREFILSKGRGCHVSKDISNAFIANSQSIPKAITYWVLFFTINGIVTHDVPLGWEPQRWFVNERLRPSFPF